LTKSARNGLFAFVAALVIIVGGFAYRQFAAPPDETVRAPFSIGGPFALVDADGVERRDTDFRGKLMLVYFGYTFCPDVCPTTLTMMSDTLVKLGARASQIAPIFITVDPARDTPAQMKQYMESFDRRFVALTGSPEQIAAAAGAYRVYYRKASGEGGQYTMDHSSVIYLMARDGGYLGHFDSAITADDLARALKKYL
jgi:cytochrome oxidase Cu insertion factor (SCO1/SenC/PrrC family)